MQLKVKIHYLSIIYFNTINSGTYTYEEAQTVIEQMFVRVNTFDLYNTGSRIHNKILEFIAAIFLLEVQCPLRV